LYHDELHAGKHPKFQSILIGQFWKTVGHVWLKHHRAAPPWTSPARANIVLWMLTPRARERQNAFNVLSKNLGTMLQQCNYDDVFEVYKKIKFVLSPFGQGPDCH